MNEINSQIIVSIIIPIRNEEKYIDKCIQSILNQDYSQEKMEVIFVDGLSQDNTKEVIYYYIEKYPRLFKILENPNKTVPFAMNIGINNSIGKYIIRLDAHSEYTNDYISKCISKIEEIDADNVGGLAIAKGYGFIGEAFAKVLSSKFGVGNSGFRTNANSGYVDTVPFGAFKRETFEKYGVYDERLTRNQDYELNYRIRKNGGKIYLASDIKLNYFCRNTLSGILKQSYENGKWNVITSKLCPGTMSFRHYIPLLFLLSILILPILGSIKPLLMCFFNVEVAFYLILNIFFSLKIASMNKRFFMILFLFPFFHITYGLGSLAGLISNIQKTHFILKRF